MFNEAFERLGLADQDEVQYLINLLCIDPQPNGRSRRVFELPQGTVLCSTTETHWVSYRILGEDEFLLMACGRFPPE